MIKRFKTKNIYIFSLLVSDNRCIHFGTKLNLIGKCYQKFFFFFFFFLQKETLQQTRNYTAVTGWKTMVFRKPFLLFLPNLIHVSQLDSIIWQSAELPKQMFKFARHKNGCKTMNVSYLVANWNRTGLKEQVSIQSTRTLSHWPRGRGPSYYSFILLNVDTSFSLFLSLFLSAVGGSVWRTRASCWRWRHQCEFNRHPVAWALLWRAVHLHPTVCLPTVPAPQWDRGHHIHASNQ